jgi:lipopolysaccharide export system permease protein
MRGDNTDVYRQINDNEFQNNKNPVSNVAFNFNVSKKFKKDH